MAVLFSTYLTGGPPYMQKLVPGDVLTKTIQFQIPPTTDDRSSRDLYLWAETSFSRRRVRKVRTDLLNGDGRPGR